MPDHNRTDPSATEIITSNTAQSMVSLPLLLDAVTYIARSQTIDSLLGEAGVKIRPLLRFDRCLLALTNGHAVRVRPLPTGTSNDRAPDPSPFEEELLRDVIAMRSKRRQSTGTPPQSVLCLPLSTQDDILGAILFRFPAGTHVSKGQLYIAESIVTNLAVAIDRLQQIDDLARSNRALERSNIELQHFAYTASHDLQTPLRSISGFVQLLEKRFHGQIDEQASDWIERVVNATERMQSLIQDLLAYSRIDSRAQPFAPVDCGEVFEDALEMLGGSMSDAGATVERGDLPAVMGDRSQIVQLFQNLIGNAVKYHHEKPPHVFVSAERKEDAWVFSVKDNGIGIASDQVERIFEIFRRLHTTREYPGTGIGLAVCRRVVHRHGGTIWVESEPGRGSTFKFTIPDRGSTSIMTENPQQGRPAEILLAEDNEDDILLAEEGFRMARLSVNLHHVDNGLECLSFLRKQSPYEDAPTPDLILLDLNMPVMDGREMLAEMIKDETLAHLPVVVLTTANEHEEIMRLYRMRVNSYIRKPLNFDEFLRVIRQIGEYWFTVAVLPTSEDSKGPIGPRL